MLQLLPFIARASNGGILITTKKVTHAKGVGVTASFGVTVGLLDPSTLPTYQTLWSRLYGAGNEPNGQYDPFNSFYHTSVFNSNGQSVLVAQTPNDAGTGSAYNANLMVYNWDAWTVYEGLDSLISM